MRLGMNVKMNALHRLAFSEVIFRIVEAKVAIWAEVRGRVVVRPVCISRVPPWSRVRRFYFLNPTISHARFPFHAGSDLQRHPERVARIPIAG